MNSDTLYCLCKKPYENTQFMIECDVCKDWFHGSCVNIGEKLADDIEFYHCPECQLTHGPLILKKKRIQQRYNHNNKMADSSESKTGSMKFLEELKQRAFPSADSIPLVRLDNGYMLCEGLLDSSGFECPILITSKQGLELHMPPEGFGVGDVEKLIGSDRDVDVIDVAEQENVVMSLHQWTNYYNNFNTLNNPHNSPHDNNQHRDVIYNLISLEFSHTRLADIVSPPQLIHRISWTDKFWPRHQHCLHVLPPPSVQRYCLMSVADSFTDFHIDFGGSSVWYHIFKGEKIFYLIRPTASNLVLYERWLSSSNQTTTFFADQVDTCFILSIKQGETILIPSGWIHAVLTPINSLVFGGNFLTHHNIPTQLKVYEIERRVRTEDKFLFPYYETLCWYAGHHFLRLLSELSERGGVVEEKLGVGIKALVTSLKAWTSPRNNSGSHDTPPSCSCLSESAPSLIRELHKKLKLTAPYLNKNNKKSPLKKTTTTVDRYRINYRRSTQPNNNNYPIRLRLAGGRISEYEEDGNNNNKIYEDHDDDDDTLVVDERTRIQKQQQQHNMHQQYNLQQNNLQQNDLQNHNIQQYNNIQHNNLQQQSLLSTKLKTPYVSSSINNIVNNYQEPVDNNSHCNMRDAIQGMLSMSQMDASHANHNLKHNYTGHNNTGHNHTATNHTSGSHKSRTRYYSDDIEEELNSCYKDDNFVYPSLVSSDSEDGGKVSKKMPVDEAWNPKTAHVTAAGRSSRRTASNRITRTLNKNKIKNFPNESQSYSHQNYFENNNNINHNNNNNIYNHNKINKIDDDNDVDDDEEDDDDDDDDDDDNMWNEENNNKNNININNNNNNNININNNNNNNNESDVDIKRKSDNDSLVERIHDMHNYSSNSYYANKKTKFNEYVANSADDDVDLSGRNTTPFKNMRGKKTPTTAKQRLAHKLKLNKDFY